MSDNETALPASVPQRPLIGGPLGGLSDQIFKYGTMAFGLSVLVLIIWIGDRLFIESALTRHQYGLSMLTSSNWDVVHGKYGARPFVYGTLVSSTLALLLAVPIGVGAAIFLTEIAPLWLATPIAFLVELLAAVPSVIFGLWGIVVLCPFLQDHLNDWLSSNFGTLALFAGTPSPSNMLAAGIILAIMILPIITSVSREVIRTVPLAQREASLGLGATRWETIRSVVLVASRSGITGAVILALGRAIGETMAVVMVIGNDPHVYASLLKPGYTMPGLLANQFNEAQNDPLQRSALLEIALILFVITLLVNGAARLLILMMTRSSASRGQIPTTMRQARSKRLFSGIAKWGALATVIAIAAIQVWHDIQRHGIAFIKGPIEILVLLVVSVRILTAACRRIVSWWTRWRRLNNGAMYILLSFCALLACMFLGMILVYVTKQGMAALNTDFFTKLPGAADDPHTGMMNAIVGTLELVGLGSCIGIPVGLMGGIFLAEFGNSRIGGFVRFSADVLNGIPSVVIGMFAYAAFVLPVGHFSAMAGGKALGIMMIPTIMRTTEEMLRLVPNSIREASLGLGATRTRTMAAIILPAARSGIVTGMMLACARIAGETAPLIFTAFGNNTLSTALDKPISSMTMVIYQYATSPYEVWINQAWAGALVLLMLVLCISVSARVVTRNKYALH